VIALSPLSDIFCESSAGGSFGRVLKLCGIDGMVVTGASSKPVMLVLDDGEIEIRDAAHLWGKDIFECDDALKAEYGKKLASAVIGPAGENLIPMAVIAHDGRHTRVAGRGGMGAVMGSKKLKAIVIPKPGVTQPEYDDPKGLAETLKTDTAAMKEALEMFSKFGTPGSLTNNERLGNLPINNWRDARAIDLQGKINGFTMAETIQVKRAGCKRCPFLCGRVVEVDEKPFATDGIVEAPEYETLGTLGSMQLVDDLKGIAKANELCNRYGLDTITLGGTVAFANECFEKGVLTLADTDGLELGMGRPEANIELIHRIANRTGDLGRILAKGSRQAAREIGKGAEEYTVEVKGFELAMHDPRFSWGQALGYATSNRGACHLSTIAHAYELVVNFPEIGLNEPAPGREREGKADLVVNLQNFQNMRDSLIFCNFDQLNNAAKATTFINWYNLITGNGMTFDDFMQAGERGFQLKRLINNRRGITRKDDMLPLRMQTLKKVGEDIDYDVPPINQMLSDYYDLRGWSEEGRPTGDTVKKFGLADFAAA
ncbi:MAG: hypothetical protein MI741_01280, partial [Rhodospirillales bacterium]|nr:hypothetical protein [Rhodospirillales bacterium]